jgi:hypothetical protein
MLRWLACLACVGQASSSSSSSSSSAAAAAAALRRPFYLGKLC